MEGPSVFIHTAVGFHHDKLRKGPLESLHLAPVESKKAAAHLPDDWKSGDIILWSLSPPSSTECIFPAKFSILCHVIFLVSLQGKFDIDHSWWSLISICVWNLRSTCHFYSFEVDTCDMLRYTFTSQGLKDTAVFNYWNQTLMKVAREKSTQEQYFLWHKPFNSGWAEFISLVFRKDIMIFLWNHPIVTFRAYPDWRSIMFQSPPPPPPPPPKKRKKKGMVGFSNRFYRISIRTYSVENR